MKNLTSKKILFWTITQLIALSISYAYFVFYFMSNFSSIPPVMLTATANWSVTLTCEPGTDIIEKAYYYTDKNQLGYEKLEKDEIFLIMQGENISRIDWKGKQYIPIATYIYADHTNFLFKIPAKALQSIINGDGANVCIEKPQISNI